MNELFSIPESKSPRLRWMERHHLTTEFDFDSGLSLARHGMKVIGKEDSSSTYIDKLYSGNYIVTAVVHRITRAEHKCNLELAKSHTNNI